MLADAEILIRLLTAAALGSLIGFERERLLWAAGIRTHMLVCVGACLFMIVSAFGFSESRALDHVSLDPSRVAAQVVSGIGFLGAGAILARGEIVRGLTTAASIWTVAAIGLAVGGGLYFAAVASTAIILIILAGVKPLEEAYRARNQSCRMIIEADHGALTPERLRDALKIRRSRIKRFLVKTRRGKKVDDVSVVLARIAPADAQGIAEAAERIGGVRAVKILGPGEKAPA